MATENDSASHPASKPAPIPCTVLRGDPLNALLAVDSESARIVLGVDVLGDTASISFSTGTPHSTSRCASLVP